MSSALLLLIGYVLRVTAVPGGGDEDRFILIIYIRKKLLRNNAEQPWWGRINEYRGRVR
ncbi:hypothetical protein D3C75_1376850 [compost metagenome]